MGEEWVGKEEVDLFGVVAEAGGPEAGAEEEEEEEEDGDREYLVGVSGWDGMGEAEGEG